MEYVNQSPVFRRYTAIRQTIYNPNNREYPNVGGRGIGIYWQTAREFHEYVIGELGPPPNGFSSKLVRIDQDEDFAPGNLRWETPNFVGRKAKPGRKYCYKKQCLTIREWHERTGISIETLYGRAKRGLTVGQMLELEPVKRKYVKTRKV